MNPGAPPPASQASSSSFNPSSSPLHPPSVMHNARVLSALSTLAACFSGLVAGILGLTNLPGFLLYLGTSLLSALTVGILKCGGGDMEKYVPQAHTGQAGAPGAPPGAVGGGGGTKSWRGWLGLMGLGQENLLGFLLFWIGSYALIHVYD